MKTLNAIPADRLLANAAFTRELLDDLQPPAAGAVAAEESYQQSAGELSLQLALYSYGLASPAAEVRALFQQAAAHLAEALSRRGVPDPSTTRGLWQSEQFVNVVACFGDASDRTRVAGLAPHQYRNPLHPEDDALAVYVTVVLDVLGGARPDVGRLEQVVEVCTAATASRDQRQLLLPAARGLLALAARDADAWNLALAQLLAAHGRAARSGALKLLPAGLCSLRALMLAKLGLDTGLPCRASSVYLPLRLLPGVNERQ